MSIEIALRSVMLADADVVAVVGTRISPKLPQNPAKDANGVLLTRATYQRISRPMDPLIDLAWPRFQITTWAEPDGTASGVEKAETAAEKIRYRLQRYKGVVDGVRILRITFLDDHPMVDPERGYDMVAADYQVKYWEE